MAGIYHDANSAGNVMLLVGPDKESIRASSQVLSLASPVFAKMLGTHFAEGQFLLERGSFGNSAVSTTEITLPEDDPEAMTLFCDTIHFKKHATPDIALPLLAKMASLSDKYDSSLALSPVSEVWLSNFQGSKEGEGCFAKMLWISYALGNHRAFSRISRAMIRVCNHDELAQQKHETGCTSLPETVIDSAEEIRASDFSYLCNELGSLLTRHIQEECQKTLRHNDDDGEICYHLAKTGFYIQELNRIDLWPIPYATTAKSIQEVSGCLLKFSNYPVEDCTDVTGMMCCDEANIDFKEHLLQATATISKRNSGLCLNCVKKGKIMSADGNCRAASLELCKNLF